jgi:putative peptidoglycan lipid II flippase
MQSKILKKGEENDNGFLMEFQLLLLIRGFMTVDTQTSVKKSISSFFYGTMISRVSGMLRDMALAFFFGSGAFIAAFMVAFRFANLLRRLFGESSLQAGFIPHFESIKTHSQEKAAFFYRDLFFSMFFFLSLVSLGGELFLYFLNFFNFEPGNKQIIFLVQLMLPGFVFICLYSLNSSLMQCERKYFLPALAPAMFNLVWIIAAYSQRKVNPEQAIINMAIATFLAFFMQWFVTSFFGPRFFSRYVNPKEFFKPKLFSKGLKDLVKPLSLGVLGVGAVQINTALDAFFARAADLSGPAYLWYAMRLYQLPLALFGVAISGALLPPLSRAFQNGDSALYKNFLFLFLRRGATFMISATVAIVALGGLSINLLFGRGEFGQTSIYNTTLCLWFYSLGLVFSTFVLILSSAFYAQKNYLIPARGAIYSVFLNVFLNLIFVFLLHWKAGSIAIATTISSIFNFFFLLTKLGEPLFDRDFLIKIVKILFCNVLALVFSLIVGHFLLRDPTLSYLINISSHYTFPSRFFEQLINFSLLTFVYFCLLIIFAYLTNSKEIIEFIKIKKANRLEYTGLD